jgi:hypothetical protein
MLVVKLREGCWIIKDRGRMLEGYTMLFQIPLGFDGIPLKLILERFGHCGILSRN